MFKFKGSKFVIAIFILLSFCIIGILIMLGYNNENFKTFSTENWIKHHDSRKDMLDDLYSKYKLVGVSKDNIISLLGKPEYNYDLSIGYFVREGYIDPVFLDFKLDKTGSVISYSLNHN